MAGLATMAQGQPKQQAQKGGGVVVPFVRAAHQHFEPMFDQTRTPGASSVNVGQYDVPAYGFLRHVWIHFSGSGSNLGGGSLSADYPFNILDEIVLLDVNGAPIVGPFSSFQLYAANTFGGYAWSPRPEDAPDYVGTIDFDFALRLPVEITFKNGLGSLANQNAAASFKVRLTQAPSTTLFSVAPTTPPDVRYQAYVECWSQPSQTDVHGNAQQTEPPAHGTTQFWTVYEKSVSNGAQTVILPRVGNLIRNLIFINRDEDGLRTTTSWPDPVNVNWDARQMIAGEPSFYRRAVMQEEYGIPIADGIFVYDFTHDDDGHPGNEDRNLWLPTVQATRLEIQGTFGADANNLEILTNDVAPVGAPVTPVGGPVGGR